MTSAILAALASACAEAEPPRPTVADGAVATRADLVLHQARLVRLVDGKTVARVAAGELRYRRERGEFAADRVRASLLPGSQARALDSFGAVDISAPEVLGDSGSQRVRGQGGVVARAARGDSAEGESVVWDGRRKLLQCDQPVSIEGSGYSMRGGALEASTDGEHFVLSRGAQGTLTQRRETK